MPFDSSFDDIYKLGIKSACEAAGAYCERVDEQLFQESILERIYNQIAKSDLIVSDMTGRNPNVFYETGYAHGLGKRVILLTQRPEDIPFDLKHYTHILYKGRITKLKDELERWVRWAIAEPQSSLTILRLRSKGTTLSVNQVKAMIATHGFYCTGWNETGKGIKHRYEIKARGDDLVVIDYAAGLMWKRDVSEYVLWTEAEGYIRSLNSAKFGGFEDWRVPTLEEAMSLVTTKGDAIEVRGPLKTETLHLDQIFEVQAHGLWIADLETGETRWGVSFWEGNCFVRLNPDFHASVRAVRSLQPTME